MTYIMKLRGIIKMDDKKSTDSDSSDTFEDQIADVPAESIKSESDFPPLQSVEYPSKKPLKEPIRKSKNHIISLIVTIAVIFLIISAFFLPWYCVSIEMSMFFFMPMEIESDVNFRLTGVDLGVDAGMMTNQINETSMSFSYNEIKEEAEAQGKDIDLNIFDNTMYLIIATLVTAILSLIGVLGIIFHFKNKNKMKKLGALFGVIAFILAFVTVGYFMLAWDSTIMNETPSMMENAPSSATTDQSSMFGSNESTTDYSGLGFWDSKSLSLGSDNDSTGGFFSSMFFSASVSTSPGYAWYLIIAAGIIVLISSIILIGKKIKILLPIVVVIAVILIGVLWFASLNAEPESSTKLSMDGFDLDSWGEEASPEEISRFIGTWHVDVESSTGYHSGYNYTEETWILWENETYNNYKIFTVYENGRGSEGSTWSVRGDKLYCSGSYSYKFSDNDNHLTLLNEQETIVLNKLY